MASLLNSSLMLLKAVKSSLMLVHSVFQVSLFFSTRLRVLLWNCLKLSSAEPKTEQGAADLAEVVEVVPQQLQVLLGLLIHLRLIARLLNDVVLLKWPRSNNNS